MGGMADIQTLDKKGLRNFGLSTGMIIVVLFGLFFPWFLAYQFPWWPWLVAGILWVFALIAPSSLGVVYYYWMKVALMLGWLNTRIILGIVFVIVMIPLGLCLRMISGDPMARKRRGDLLTYRVLSKQPSRDSLRRLF